MKTKLETLSVGGLAKAVWGATSHYGADFERIAAVAAQEHEWVVARDSI